MAQSSPVDMRLAMLGGLLHDIGEAYIQPQYLDGEEPLDLLGHKHMMVHPRIAQLLLSATTDYPATLCRAVGEHHERHNGSGYPARLYGDAISPLGMLLAAVETTMGLARRAQRAADPRQLCAARGARRIPRSLQQRGLQHGPQRQRAGAHQHPRARRCGPAPRQHHATSQAQQTAQALQTNIGSTARNGHRATGARPHGPPAHGLERAGRVGPGPEQLTAARPF